VNVIIANVINVNVITNNNKKKLILDNFHINIKQEKVYTTLTKLICSNIDHN